MHKTKKKKKKIENMFFLEVLLNSEYFKFLFENHTGQLQNLRCIQYLKGLNMLTLQKKNQVSNMTIFLYAKYYLLKRNQKIFIKNI